MENSSTTFSSMNTEFIVDAIMSRLDGPSLAASATACSELRAAASDQTLWKNLCTATWPSTESEAAQQLLSKGFDKFYANAFPLILCQAQESAPNPTVAHASSSDLASLIDIYYKGKCILSRVLDAIPEPADVHDDKNHGSDELLQWLKDCPFRLDLLPYSDDADIIDTNNDDYTELVRGGENDRITYLPSLTSSTENGKRGLDLRDELAEDFRLSWILFDKKTGKAVNLSSWKPMFVQKSWAPNGEYVLHFGSIIPVGETSLLPNKFAECKIVARCQVIENSGYAKWTEISMRVENMAGAHLNTANSLWVLNQALCSKRTAKHIEVEKANLEYKMYKKEMKRRDDRRDYLVDKLYALVGLTVLTTITYGCTMLFQ